MPEVSADRILSRARAISQGVASRSRTAPTVSTDEILRRSQAIRQGVEGRAGGRLPSSIGLPEEERRRVPWWQTALHTLGYLGGGQYAITNALKSIAGMTPDNPLTAAWKGLIGKERSSYSDFLNAWFPDKDPEHIGAGDVAKGTAGFVADLALDPLTYVFGASLLPKVGGRVLSRAGIKAAEEIAQAAKAGGKLKTGEEVAKHVEQVMIRRMAENPALVDPGGIKWGLGWINPKLPSATLIPGATLDKAKGALGLMPRPWRRGMVPAMTVERASQEVTAKEMKKAKRFGQKGAAKEVVTGYPAEDAATIMPPAPAGPIEKTMPLFQAARDIPGYHPVYNNMTKKYFVNKPKAGLGLESVEAPIKVASETPSIVPENLRKHIIDIEDNGDVLLSRVPEEMLNLDPERFQFRSLITARGVRLGEKIPRWKPESADAIEVWFDPADGKLYVFNGHHRFEILRNENRIRAKEGKAPIPYPKVKVRNLPTAEDALLDGALHNIRQGTADAVDAAMVFRLMDMTPEIAAAEGITGQAYREGMALKNLSTGAFERLKSKLLSIPQEDGKYLVDASVEIGEKVSNHNQQMVYLSKLIKDVDDGKKINVAAFKTFLKHELENPSVDIDDVDIFGNTIVKRTSLSSEFGKIVNRLGYVISKKKTVAAFLASEGRTSLMEEMGLGIANKPEARSALGKLQHEQHLIKEVLPKLYGDKLYELAAELKAGKKSLSDIVDEMSDIIEREKGYLEGRVPNELAKIAGDQPPAKAPGEYRATPGREGAEHGPGEPGLLRETGGSEYPGGTGGTGAAESVAPIEPIIKGQEDLFGGAAESVARVEPPPAAIPAAAQAEALVDATLPEFYRSALLKTSRRMQESGFSIARKVMEIGAKRSAARKGKGVQPAVGLLGEAIPGKVKKPPAFTKKTIRKTAKGFAAKRFVNTEVPVATETEGWIRAQRAFDMGPEAAEKIPVVGKAASGTARGLISAEDWLGKGFNPGHIIPEDMYQEFRFLQHALDYGKQVFTDELARVFRGVNEAARKALPHALEANKIGDVPESAQRLFNWVRNTLDQMWAEEVKEGILGEGQRIENYVSHIYPKMSDPGKQIIASMIKKNEFFTKERLIDTLKKAQAAGLEPIDDIVKILAIRMQAHYRAMATSKFMKFAAQKYGKKLSVTEKVMPLGWQGVAHDAIKEYVFHPEIAAYLNRTMQIVDDKSAMQGFLKVWRTVQNFWKQIATQVNIMFHSRNALSNVWQNYVAGVNDPRRYFESLEVMFGDPNKTINLNGIDYTYRELREIMGRQGVLNLGWIGSDVAETIMQKVKKIEQPWRKYTPFNMGREAGKFVENNARTALFIDRLAKGDSAQEAAQKVFKYLFDYTELTDFERGTMTAPGLRDLIPFYTWSRKNVPLQVQTLLERPGVLGMAEKIRRGIEGGPGSEEEIQELPKWMKTQYQIRLPWKDRKGNTLYARFGLPFEDLNRLGNPFVEFYSLLTPLIKEPAEQIAGYDVFTGRNIQPYSPEIPGEYQTTKTFDIMKRLPEPMRRAMGVKTFAGPSGEDRVEMNARLAHAMRTAVRPVSELGRLMEPDVSPGVRAFNALSGGRIYPYEEIVEAERLTKANREIDRQLRRAKKKEGRRIDVWQPL